MKARLCWKTEFSILAQRHGPRTALIDGEGALTYDALFRHAAGAAQALQHRNLVAGVPVASYLPNARAAVWTSLAITLAGGADTAINPYLAEEEVSHCLVTAGARLLVTTAERFGRLQVAGALPQGVEVLLVEELGEASLADLPARTVEGGAWGKIIFTSGTTGRPKGIVHSHAGRWLANLTLRAHLPIVPAPGLNVLLLTPFSHGASLMAYAYLDGGATITLLHGVEVADVLRRLRSGEVDQLFAPPTVLAKLMAGLKEEKIDGVRTIFCGTAPLAHELYERVRDCFGPVVRITYGKSEIFNPITVLRPEETEAWYRSGQAPGSCVGWPASGVELCIDPEEGSPNEHGQMEGPVLIRANHQLAGLLIDGAFTSQDANAFHRSGDLGFIDDQGRLRLTGRESDLMKSGGYRIGPEEVEALLRPALPNLDFVVLGLPSPYWGEVVTAVAASEREDWHTPFAPTIAAMTAYKRPRLFARLAALPRNAMGKVVRAAAREAVLRDYEMTDGPRPTLTRRR